MKNILVIDLGGSSSKCAIVSSSKKEILLEFSVTTDINNVLQNLKNQIEKILQINNFFWKDISAIGVAVPGFLDIRNGVVRLAGNLNFHDYPIEANMKKLFNKPIVLINDANAAAYGEYFYYEKKYSNLILYSLGTGVGGSIINDGKLVTGYHSFAGEFGHGGYFQDYKVCNCGLKNCLEVVASASGVNHLIQEFAKKNPNSFISKLSDKPEKLSTIQLKQLFDSNDKSQLIEAKEILLSTIIALVQHMSIMIYAFDPEIIILAGGLTMLGQKFLDWIKLELKNYISNFYHDVKVHFSSVKSKAGLYGIIAYTIDVFKKQENNLKKEEWA
ncbi:MAG: ROK family protein [Spiroplasma sp.]